MGRKKEYKLSSSVGESQQIISNFFFLIKGYDREIARIIQSDCPWGTKIGKSSVEGEITYIYEDYRCTIILFKNKKF